MINPVGSIAQKNIPFNLTNYLERFRSLNSREAAKYGEVCQIWRLVASEELGVLLLEMSDPGGAVIVQGLTDVLLQSVAAFQSLADQPHGQRPDVDDLRWIKSFSMAFGLVKE